MSFLNKIKGWGQKGDAAMPSALDGDVAVADDYGPRRGASARGAADLPLADVEPAAAFDAMPQATPTATPTSSIISEAAPSEMRRLHRDRACRTPTPARRRRRRAAADRRAAGRPSSSASCWRWSASACSA